MFDVKRIVRIVLGEIERSRGSLGWRRDRLRNSSMDFPESLHISSRTIMKKRGNKMRVVDWSTVCIVLL